MNTWVNLFRIAGSLAMSFSFFSCTEQVPKAPAQELVQALNLKKGALISCGPESATFGNVSFTGPSTSNVKKDFNVGISLLHSFEYDEAEKVFSRIIAQHPTCAMAYWGVAMSNFHPLWAPPSPPELDKGTRALAIARSISNVSPREKGYIDALSAFYTDADKADHRTRCIRFEQAMKNLSNTYPDDKEAAIFYALSMAASADPTDKTYTRQKAAGAVLNALYPGEPNHPGIVHYIIHTYDYPGLAHLALPAARKYATVAPSSAHALHMPSHIFTRLGLWNELLSSNLASVASAQCYAKAAGMSGHWDEELHAMDYLVYGYLQRGENALAKKQIDYLRTIQKVEPTNFKVAYAFAAMPARYVLENRLWKEAALLEPAANVPWERFGWQKAIIHFTRLMGAVHSGNQTAAKTELALLEDIHSALTARKETYMANQVQVQLQTAGAWLRYRDGDFPAALSQMNAAADLEDKTEKHPVTPGEVLPARELLGDMLLEMDRAAEALVAYEASLQTHRNRFNGLAGAAVAAERSGDQVKAEKYYRRLISISDSGSSRQELLRAKQYLRQTPLVKNLLLSPGLNTGTHSESYFAGPGAYGRQEKSQVALGEGVNG